MIYRYNMTYCGFVIKFNFQTFAKKIEVTEQNYEV